MDIKKGSDPRSAVVRFDSFTEHNIFQRHSPSLKAKLSMFFRSTNPWEAVKEVLEIGVRYPKLAEVPHAHIAHVAVSLARLDPSVDPYTRITEDDILAQTHTFIQ